MSGVMSGSWQMHIMIPLSATSALYMLVNGDHHFVVIHNNSNGTTCTITAINYI